MVGDSVRFNTVAAKIMSEHGVLIDDMYAYSKPRLAKIQRRADVHFTPDPDLHGLPDIAADPAPGTHGPIDRVGMERIELPVLLRDARGGRILSPAAPDRGPRTRSGTTCTQRRSHCVSLAMTRRDSRSSRVSGSSIVMELSGAPPDRTR